MLGGLDPILLNDSEAKAPRLRSGIRACQLGMLLHISEEEKKDSSEGTCTNLLCVLNVLSWKGTGELN